MTDQSLLEDFTDETREHIDELESSLLRLESDPADRELLNTIFRSMHTIKGSSEYLGFDHMARLSHRLENLLDLFRDGSMMADKIAIDLLIDARDRIGELVSQIEASGKEESPIDDLMERVEAIITGSDPSSGILDGGSINSDETDTELLDIFLDQLVTGVKDLVASAKGICREDGGAEGVGQLATQLDQMAATANYMGFDILAEVYTDMSAATQEISSRWGTVGLEDISEFIQTTVVDGIDHIKALFPDAQSLQSINTQIAVQVLDNPSDLLSSDEELFSETDDWETASQALVFSQEAGPSLIEDFTDETREHIDELESSLLHLASDPANRELLDTIFRSMHTIKGASEYLGFDHMARLSHRLENLLDLFREGSMVVDKVAIDLLIDARDRIGELVSQVEASGKEESLIDDLMDRVEAIISGSDPCSGESDQGCVKTDETDTELFDIFMDQLVSGLQELIDSAHGIFLGDDGVKGMCDLATQLNQLAATANYMGFDALSQVYADMLASTEVISSRSETPGVDDMNDFIQSTIVAGTGRIQALFANEEKLAAIDTTVLTKVADHTPLSDQLPSSDIDQLLDGLPEIDEDERQSILSRTLDESFSSMQNSFMDADENSDAQTEGDPVAFQFSLDEDEDDFQSSIQGMDSDQDDTEDILDDFVLEKEETEEPDARENMKKDMDPVVAQFYLDEDEDDFQSPIQGMDSDQDDTEDIIDDFVLEKEETEEPDALENIKKDMDPVAAQFSLDEDKDDFQSPIQGMDSDQDDTEDILDEFVLEKEETEESDALENMKKDMDPVTAQFSLDEDEDDFESPTLGMDSDQEEAQDILDDVVLEEAENTQSPDAGEPIEKEVDLWPKAARISGPVLDEPVETPEIRRPVIDLSTPAPSEPMVINEAEPEPVSPENKKRKSIRVDAGKVDDLMNQVGELVVNRSSFTQLYQEMGEMIQYFNHRFPMEKADQRIVSRIFTRLNDATTTLGRVTGELQEQVMKVRMLPISRLFNRFPRLVHDLLRDSNKKTQLQFSGEDTELDRVVIEQLADPMIHIIRNAVDHGIESCEERQRNGKPDSGVLLLEAFHEGSNVVIHITDDGKGIDLSRIRKKAVEKKLADRETLDQMDEKELIEMIMLPGFSTADSVTHLSGRGVGMDVVKRNIEKINGKLDIDTRQGVGTRIRIKIPLTLAIIPALMIRSGSSHFTMPLGVVEETLRIDQGEIFTVDGSEVMHLREEPLPLVRLTDLLNMETPPQSAKVGQLFVVVVNASTGRTGFIVDTLMGRQEVVIKPMEDYLQENSGFSGATILGDGTISLILNVDELVVMAKEQEAERRLAAAIL